MGQTQQADGGWQQAGKATMIETKKSRQKAKSKTGQEVKNWQTGKRTDRMHTGRTWLEGRGQVKVGWYCM